MKTILKHIYLLTLIIFILSESSFSFASSQHIKWYPYKQGAELSKIEGKKIFLYFYADWCTYCKKMENGTFKDDSVISYLNDNFIPIKVNSDLDSKTASDFRIIGLPTIWFIAENGDRISNLSRYETPKILLNILKYINTDSYKEMAFRKFMEL